MKKWKFSWTCCEHVFTCRHADGGSNSPAIAEGEVEAHTIADAAHMVCDTLKIDLAGHWDADILELVVYPEAKLNKINIRVEVSFDDHDIVGYVREIGRRRSLLRQRVRGL